MSTAKDFPNDRQRAGETVLLHSLTAIKVLDCGDVDGCRYQIEAIAIDLGDTSRAASMHVGSFFSREAAEMVADALRTQQQQNNELAAPQPNAIAESLTHLLADLDLSAHPDEEEALRTARDYFAGLNDSKTL